MLNQANQLGAFSCHSGACGMILLWNAPNSTMSSEFADDFFVIDWSCKFARSFCSYFSHPAQTQLHSCKTRSFQLSTSLKLISLRISAMFFYPNWVQFFTPIVEVYDFTSMPQFFNEVHFWKSQLITSLHFHRIEQSILTNYDIISWLMYTFFYRSESN